MIPTVVQQVHAHPHIRRRVPLGRLSHLSVAAAFLVAAVLMEAPEQMRVKAQSSNTQGLCDTSGTVLGEVEGSCSLDKPVLCCDGEECIQRSWITDQNNYRACGDRSDETAVPFSQCSAEREASPIETKTVVVVTCKPECDWRSNGEDSYDYLFKKNCQEVALTEVPTFVNKNVTDMYVELPPCTPLHRLHKTSPCYHAFSNFNNNDLLPFFWGGVTLLWFV